MESTPAECRISGERELKLSRLPRPPPNDKRSQPSRFRTSPRRNERQDRYAPQRLPAVAGAFDRLDDDAAARFPRQRST